ncbi:MAG TPA: hypothetical protein VKZ41_13940 [Gemmatimonadales bacterium]|nr:hypothetical protein [Gemmatimonadales bacterium]
MPSREIELNGELWKVYPSGFRTSYSHDEFGLIFVRGKAGDREVRVTRYTSWTSRSRERSLRELSDADLRRLFQQSQASDTSPEAGYLS